MSQELHHVIIRTAKKEDMIEVHKMIKRHAEFEQMPGQVETDETVLMKDGFETDSPAFSCYVADDNGKVVGFALYYYCYSTYIGKAIFLEDLYVEDAYRKLGIGRNLFLAVAKIAYETSNRLDLHVMSWNSAMEFYKKMGCIDLTESENRHVFRLNGKHLNNLFK